MESMIYPSGQSGIFYGPWTPIYGFGAIIILLIASFLKKKIKSKVILLISLFFSSAIILSILEYIGGISIEIIFNKTLWNYSKLPMNIGKYIAVEMALIWGIGSIIIVFILQPIIDKFISKIPVIITYLLIIFFSLDVILSLLFIS